jgi:8-oxo-dGTP pyrophosphatase MutT (NUDIX family)
MHLTSDLLAAISGVLPRIAEESSDREAIPEASLIQRLSSASGVGLERASAELAVVRRLLQALSALDERCLASGEWAFVSFPAYLMARSLLCGLGSADFRLLDRGFWDPSDYRIDRQRALIKNSEELRVALPTGLVPIRRVWVSWAWIALDGRFLVVRREDPALHREGSRGQFVFPGGRISPQDLPNLPLGERLDFFDPDREVEPVISANAFITTLKRELEEELGIAVNDLDTQEPTGNAIRFRALEGGKSAFSATEYRIQPFKISLTDSGKTRLLRCLAAHPDRFDWFTAEELEAGVNAAGAKAFVDAIRHKGMKLDPTSHDIAVSKATPIQDPIDIPGSVGEPFSIGITGRERQVHVALDSDDVGILAWLLALRRGEQPSELAPNVAVVRGRGWVFVGQDEVLSRLKALAAKLEAKGLHLLDFHERAVRLNAVTPYFSPALLSLEIHDERRGKAYSLTMSRRSLQSALGIIPERTATATLPEILGNAIYALAQNAPGPALDNMDTVKRMQRDIRPFLEGIGARLLLRQVDGVPELAVAQSSIER